MDPLAESVLRPLWLDNPARPEPRPALDGPVDTDLLVVGGGFTGLWTALRAVERQPDRRVLLIEADRIAEHATGRNGGFCEASLTHGEANGRERWPDEYDVMHELGMRNLSEIEQTLGRHGIDCGWARGGQLDRGDARARGRRAGAGGRRLPRRSGCPAAGGLSDVPRRPARRGRGGDGRPGPAGLGAGRRDRGAGRAHRRGHPPRVAEERRRRRRGDHKRGVVRAKHVVLATNVFPGPLRRNAWRVVPVYDYVLATEPLTEHQLGALRWDPGIGVADSGNQFHYYRLTPDRRILWGGYDAIYHYGALHRRQSRRPARDLPDPGAELRRDVPAAGGHSVHASLVGSGRHLHALLRVLRAGPPAAARRTPRGSPASASGRPASPRT